MVPLDISIAIQDAGIKRLLCTINKDLTARPTPCALMPAGDGRYFININKEKRTKYRLEEGSPIHIQLVEDNSVYGMDLCEEFEAILQTDPQFDQQFHALTPGKQRSLLYYINKIKSSEKRIEKTMIIAQHIERQKGKIDFKLLNQEMKKGLG